MGGPSAGLRAPRRVLPQRQRNWAFTGAGGLHSGAQQRAVAVGAVAVRLGRRAVQDAGGRARDRGHAVDDRRPAASPATTTSARCRPGTSSPRWACTRRSRAAPRWSLGSPAFTKVVDPPRQRADADDQRARRRQAPTSPGLKLDGADYDAARGCRSRSSPATTRSTSRSPTPPPRGATAPLPPSFRGGEQPAIASLVGAEPAARPGRLGEADADASRTRRRAR